MNKETILDRIEQVAPELVQAGITEVMEQNARLWERIYELEKEIRELKERLGELA